MANRAMGVKEAAERLGVSPGWIRKQISAGAVSPERSGAKKSGRFLLTDEHLEKLTALRAEFAGPGESMLLTRITTLEADRANLLAHVAWAQATAKEQQKSLEFERQRSRELAAELSTQQRRIEELKSLSAFDRLIGRQKAI